MRWSLVATAVMAFLQGDAQEGAQGRWLRFEPWFHDHELVLDSQMVVASGAPVTITQLRFYISHVSAQFNGRIVWSAEADVHLLDASDPSTLRMPLGISMEQRIDGITFLLGIDSLTNVSGAMGGDLDPTKGMYWTWNSGYINLKVEGTCPLSKEAKQVFNFHLGGYLPPYSNAQLVHLDVKDETAIPILVDLAVLLNKADIAARANIMSPGLEAVELARIAATMFRIAP